ncbi:kinase-like domain-containing protein [Aspergillus bertholletiae]|uniref:non-specific serine/threonine protein kinase n=1 Tax=Aspergillus bertholletiae TaxID=1226010 RepID=A0A5N7BC49_9EURO|nr:kinase-like domain-containing protein [Aspergillus bertholletiae]
MPIEDVENIGRYRPEGYHPIVIGDRLHDRYDIVHKLGFGSYSTTWLARDIERKKYVAIKISISEVNLHESKILKSLSRPDPNVKGQLGNALVISILDKFRPDGPNGKHKCFVTEPGMMSLAETKYASYTRLFQLPVARAIMAQVIQAIVFLHHRGIVHADLHTGNIVLRLLESIDSLSPEQLYEQYGRPNLEPIVRLDNQALPIGVPSQGAVPIWLGKASEQVTLSEAKIFLTDFGESFQPSTTRRHYSNTPAILVPPEVYFLPQEPVSFPADIWTLTCTLWDIVGQRPLFEGLNPSQDWMIKEHVDTLGKLPPPDWWRVWDARQIWFTEGVKRTSERSRRSLADRFINSVQEPRQEHMVESIAEDEKACLLTQSKAMLEFRPHERPTAAEIMESEWMVNWALPELAKQD